MSKPSIQAAQSQQPRYSVDTWVDLVLEPMTKVWQGIGGESDFFVSEEDAREARGAYEGTQPFQFAQTLWRLAQVEPNAEHGYRNGIREFVVDIPVKAAVGICRANPHLGSGSVLQYFIPNWSHSLHPTGREYRFDAKSYPA